MSNFGEYVTPGTFVNDSTAVPVSAAALNEFDRVLGICDTELARSKTIRFSDILRSFWMQNCKEVEVFEDEGDYTAIVGVTVKQTNTTQYLMNYSSVSIHNPNATVETIGIHITLGSTLDLAKFNDEFSSSSTEDCIALLVYAEDYDDFTALNIRLGDDSFNYYQVNWNPSTELSRDGWNVLYEQKKNFSTVGAPQG